MRPVVGSINVRITVPVKVPLGRAVGSSVTRRVTPLSGRSPASGLTDIHGLSTAAVKRIVRPGSPGTKTGTVMGRVEPTGALALGFGSSPRGTGTTTTRMVGEAGPGPLKQLEKART